MNELHCLTHLRGMGRILGHGKEGVMKGENAKKDVQNWLSRFGEKKEEIAWKTEELCRLRAAAASMGIKAGETGTEREKGGGSPAENMILLITEAARELEKMKVEQMDIYVETLSALGKMTDPRERQLLMLCFLDGQSLPVTADRMRISYSLAYEIRKRAIAHLNEIILINQAC